MLGVEKLPPPNGNKLVPAVAYDVKMISMGLLVKPGQPLIWRGPMLNSAIRQFLADVEWGELDYLIIDLPPGTGDAALSLAQALPLSGAIIVTLPQLVSLEDASRGLQMFRTLEVPILGVIENMSYLDLPDGTRMDIFGSGGGEQLAQATQNSVPRQDSDRSKCAHRRRQRQADCYIASRLACCKSPARDCREVSGRQDQRGCIGREERTADQYCGIESPDFISSALFICCCPPNLPEVFPATSRSAETIPRTPFYKKPEGAGR